MTRDIRRYGAFLLYSIRILVESQIVYFPLVVLTDAQTTQKRNKNGGYLVAALLLSSIGFGSHAWENSLALPTEEFTAFAKKHCLPTNLSVLNPLADTSIPTNLPQHRIDNQ